MGRGTGKTATLVALTVLECLQYPGMRVLWLVPEAGLFDSALRPKFEALAATYEHLYGHRLITKIHDSSGRQKITLYSGNTIHFKTAKNIQSVRGMDVGLIVIDEGADVDATPESWAAFAFCLRGRGCQRILCAGTPKGLQGAMGLLLTQYNKGDQSVEVIRAASQDSPYQSPENLAFYKRTMSARLYRQEALGEIISNSGTVYSQFDPEIHIRKEPFPIKRLLRENQYKLFVCMDWGTAQNAAVFLAVRNYNGTNAPEVVAFHEIQLDQTPNVALVNQVTKYCKQVLECRPDGFVVDPAGYKGHLRTFVEDLSLCDVFMERDQSKRWVRNTVELVQRALGGDGVPVLLTLSQELAALDLNQEGGKGLVQGFKNYVFKQTVGGLSNDPIDNNRTTHALDALRYFYMNATRIGYDWENLHFAPDYSQTYSKNR